MAQDDPVQTGRGAAADAPGGDEPDLITYRSLLFRASHAQRALLHPFMASIGLGTGQPKLLSYLNHFGPCSQRELADYYELDPAGVSRALDALERKGFVTFEANADDRRAKVVTLTSDGCRVARAWDAACREEASAMLTGFTREERLAFADYLTRARTNLRAYERELIDARNDRDARAARVAQPAAAEGVANDEGRSADGPAATPTPAATDAPAAFASAAATGKEARHA